MVIFSKGVFNNYCTLGANIGVYWSKGQESCTYTREHTLPPNGNQTQNTLGELSLDDLGAKH